MSLPVEPPVPDFMRATPRLKFFLDNAFLLCYSLKQYTNKGIPAMGWKKEIEIFESAFGEEAKSSQMVVRITEMMEKALQAEAKLTGQSVADIARIAISFFLVPRFLKRRIDSGIGLESKDRFLLETYRKFLAQLNEICNEVEGQQKEFELKGAERHFAEVIKKPQFQEMFEGMARRIIEDLFKETPIKKSRKRDLKQK